MAALTYANFVLIVDKLTRYYNAMLGTSASGFGLGNGATLLVNDWGASKAARELADTVIIGSGDGDIVDFLRAPSKKLVSTSPVKGVVVGQLSPFFQALTSLIVNSAITGVADINSYATYYNTSAGGPYRALVSPEFAALFALVFPGSVIDPKNIFAAPIGNMAQRSVGGAFTAGTAVDTVTVAGAGVANVVLSGATLTGAGTPIVTVTGSARTAAGVVTAGRTFTTGTLTANGTYVLTPAVAGDILTSVSAITLPAELTAGLVVIAGAAPRTYPAT